MNQVLVLVGPTAVGKSDAAIEIAKQCNGEIISGDSIQVYRGFDIGTGKVKGEEMQGIPHYLIDILNPCDRYSVADFQEMARYKIEEIIARGKLPILVGGTGLYIKACLYDYVFQPQNDFELDKEIQAKDNEQLYAMLEEVDPQACLKIHINNRKRILRALTLALSGQSKSETENLQQHQMLYDSFILGLTCPRDELYSRINRRVDQMVQAGLQTEIYNLLAQGSRFSDQAMQGIGYHEWQPYYEKRTTTEEVVEAIKLHSRQFAKRQYTWFHNQMKVNWIDIEGENWFDQCIVQIKNWRNNNG